MAEFFLHQEQVKGQKDRREFIRQNFEKYTKEEFAAMFNVSVTTIGVDVNAILKSRGEYGTPKQMRYMYILKNPHLSHEEIAKKFNVQASTITKDINDMKKAKREGKATVLTNKETATGRETWKRNYSQLPVDKFVMNCF